MRWPRVRFTVRRLMLLVLLAAAFLATFEAGRRWERRAQSRAQQDSMRSYYEALFLQQESASEARSGLNRARKARPVRD